VSTVPTAPDKFTGCTVRHPSNPDALVLALNDPWLSWKAKGIFTDLMHSSRTSRLQMLATSSDGAESLASGLRELKDQGYLKVVRKGTATEYVLLTGGAGQ
jgi:hypothetical protein